MKTGVPLPIRKAQPPRAPPPLCRRRRSEARWRHESSASTRTGRSYPPGSVCARSPASRAACAESPASPSAMAVNASTSLPLASASAVCASCFAKAILPTNASRTAASALYSAAVSLIDPLCARIGGSAHQFPGFGKLSAICGSVRFSIKHAILLSRLPHQPGGLVLHARVRCAEGNPPCKELSEC